MKTQEEYFNDLKKDISLVELQNYINNVLEIRGFNNQSIELKLMLLMEEVGELAKSIRKDSTRLPIDRCKINNYSSIEEEIADVLIVLFSIANKLQIDLYDAFLKKEKENIKRKWKK
ncbi:hypothetical protein LIX92_06740 [Faecalibacillus faecis]|uniref:MazG nucleotide pyrophosphohydrolase domain-containing protein n=1 Tax=Faecalibacillus faecis TaxID=1982628 RepID=UPI001D07BF5B|nr:MazG nucleotide pyrophosphohydrolase domain-containing protein [Faecalibacillus faecis]MCB7489154.1 hypothetical protein [Faecalibacillus faecis]MCG4593298.1 hypothetical protein [Faecalibacillus faecis]